MPGLGTLTALDGWPARLGFVQSTKDRKTWTRGTVTLTRRARTTWAVYREGWDGSHQITTLVRTSDEDAARDLIAKLSAYLGGQS